MTGRPTKTIKVYNNALSHLMIDQTVRLTEKNVENVVGNML